MPLTHILPSRSTMEALSATFPHLVAQVITRHMPAYKKFKSTVVRHIPHRYSVEMAKQSKQVLLQIHDFLMIK